MASNNGKKRYTTLRGVDSSKLCSENEDDHDFLNTKPELGRKGKKGRRHAGEVLLARKVANEAYLIKSVVAERDEDASLVGGGKSLGKKRRARLISAEKAGGDFKLSVPYSLNRKGRWSTLLDTEGSDLLESVCGNGLSKEEQRVKISVLETDYTMKGAGGGSPLGVKSYHELDSETGVIASHYSKSKRGANLKSLLPAHVSPDDDAPPSVPASGAALKPIDLNIRYTISKPHPVLAAKHVLRGKCCRGGRRMENVFLCDTSIKGRNSTAVTLKSIAVIDRMLESMTDENCAGEELLHSYTRPERLYSLADFVKDTVPTPAVIVRNKSIVSIADPVMVDHVCAAPGNSDEFEMVSGDDSASEEEKLGDDGQSEQLREPPQHTAIKRRVEETRREKEWFFEQFKLPASSVRIHTKREWLQQCASMAKLDWIDASQARFLVDLSGQITAGSLLSPVLVCSVGYHEITQELSMTLNAAFKAPTTLASVLKASSGKSLSALLCEIADAFKHNYDKEVGRHAQSASDLYQLKATFNSPRLATQAQPIGFYKLLEEARCLELDSTAFERTHSSLSSAGSTDSADEGDFEIVELDVVSPRSLSPSIPAGVEVLKEICEHCHSESAAFLLPALCGHKFCGGCLHDELLRRVADEPESGDGHVLSCLVSGCDAHVELRFLSIVLPLPIVQLCALAQFISNREDGMLCDDCPKCGQFIVAELEREDFRLTSCAKCAIHWCRGCRHAPHWPLSCKQNVLWGEKFEQQYLIDKARIDAGNDAPSPHGDPAATNNTIAQEFSLVCSESRSRRLDERLSVQLAKHMRRLASGDRSTEQRFTRVRKTALHLLEYGVAWLYLTRGTNVVGAGARPKEWTAVKSLLSQLHKRSDSLESEVLFAGSLTDSSEVLKKVERTEELTEQLLAKLRIVVGA